jgi:uncharacterized membrane protein
MVSLSEVEPFFRVSLMGFALLLTLLMAVAAYRVKSGKLVLVTLGFLAFFIKGLLLTLGIFLTPFDRAFQANPEMILVDFVILVLIYAGMVKGS